MNIYLNILTKFLRTKYSFVEMVRPNHVVKWNVVREMATTFSGKGDIHNGVIVNSVEEPCNDIIEFTTKLEASLKTWIEGKRRAVWFKINVLQAHWIPILAEHGFQIHNGKEDVITMVRWLSTDEINRIPNYAHTMVGTGAVVLKDDGKSLLVVKEKYRQLSYWKLPGGYVEPGEDIAVAAIREVLEETNIRTEFEGLITFRHSLKAVFGCSDLYFIVSLKPLNFDIIREEEEVDDVMWMSVAEFLVHPEVHELNRQVVRKCLEQRKHKTTISKYVSPHPITGSPQGLYSISFPLCDR